MVHEIFQYTTPVSDEFANSDYVYVDPNSRKVVGRVTWSQSGRAKPLLMPDDEEQPQKAKMSVHRRKRKRMYPWCTYRTAKRVYHVEGKQKGEEQPMALDEAMKKAQKEAYWD